MPTYLYKCEDHGEFETEHSINEKLEECPKCKDEKKEPQKLIRLIPNGTSFILSGSGWARDRYS